MLPQGLFQEEKPSGDRMLPFPEIFFLNLDKTCQKQLLIWGIRPIPALLGYPVAFLLNKGAFLLKRKALFQEQF